MSELYDRKNPAKPSDICTDVEVVKDVRGLKYWRFVLGTDPHDNCSHWVKP